jgi:uncharacterized membrane protein
MRAPAFWVTSSSPAHLFIAHFPVALLLTGAAADLAGAVSGARKLRAFASALLIMGGAFALLAFLTGGGALGAAMARNPAGSSSLDVHQQLGSVGAWLLAGAAALRGRLGTVARRVARVGGAGRGGGVGRARRGAGAHRHRHLARLTPCGANSARRIRDPLADRAAAGA